MRDETTYRAMDRSQVAALHPSSVRWWIFGFIAVLTAINLADRTAISIGMPTIAHDFALRPFMQGMIMSAFFWTYALMQIPGGILIDRVGPSRIVAAAAFGWGLFQGAMMFATGGLALVALRLALGAAEAPMFPAGGKLIALWLAPSERGRGAVIMDGGNYLGAALGGIAIAWLILAFGSWRLAFGTAGIVTILASAVSLLLLRDQPSRHPAVNAAELAVISADAPQAAAAVANRLRIPRAATAAIMLGRLGWAMINFGLLTWGPSYLTQARHLDLRQMGAATFLIFGAGCIGALSAGFASDALQRRGFVRGAVLKSLLCISGLGVIAAFLLLPHVAAPGTAVALLVGTYFLVGWGSLYWSFPALLGAPRVAGIVGALMNFAGSAGGIAVPILAGALLQRTGSYDAVLIMFACCTALYIGGTLLIPFDRIAAEARA
jgi:MFS transporter, ACS family, D-galactonate transporter